MSQIGEPLLLSTTGTESTTAPLSTERKRVTRRKRKHDINKKLSNFSESKKKSIEVAAIYIEDAIHVRKPQTRIQEKGIDFKICNQRFIISPLTAYKFVHNKYWKIFLYIIIWIHLLCVIFAPKNYSEQKDPDKFNEINTWVLVVQVICLFIFIMDCVFKVYSHDKEFRYNGWQKMLYFVIFVTTVHVILSFLGENVPQKINLLLQIFRPYYLIYNARSLRGVIKSVLRSIPRIMVLVWVIAFTLCTFGLIGYELLYGVPLSNFNTFEESMLSLMILLTTANYPDVMMPAYHASPFYVIFFACFVIIILVLFLPTLLAVIYEAYHSQTQKAYSKITKTHKEALLRSFELLTHEHNGDNMDNMNNMNLFASIDELHNNSSNLLITKEVWMQFMRIVRPNLDSLKHEVLYTTLRLNEEDLTCHPNAVEYRLNSSDTPNGITQEQFLRLPEFIEIKFRVSAKAGIAHELLTLQHELANYLRNRKTRTIGNRIRSFETKIRVYLLYIFSHPMSEGIIDWMVWINTISLVAERAASDLYDKSGGHEIFGIIHASFLVVFVLEIILKVYAFGLRAFLSDKFFIFDAILVILGMVAWIGTNDTDSYVQLIRALRLLRVLKEFPQMRLLVLFLSALMRSFIILLLAQFCVFYVFAMIGMAKFDGLLGYQQILNKMNEYKNKESEDWIYWNNHMTDSSATHRYYYLNNMNSFINTMIVLMELSVVNNWQCVMEMYIKMSGNHYNRIFFIAFYFCSVILVLNVVIAFVINLFLVNYGQNISSNDLLFRYKRYIIMSILIHQLNDNEYDIYHWTIERRIRPALWYQIIFEDNVNNSIEDANIAQKIGEGEIDSSIDYDDVIQMPCSQGTLIEQFKQYTHSTTNANDQNQSHYLSTPNIIISTPEKARNILLNQSIGDIFQSMNSTFNDRHNIQRRSTGISSTHYKS